ncbi:hypothetical protein MAPG_06140 [Magnaporthiopsis poae ATCC 64411]|uniref:Uncharacterized protein n=1 Tax=Magnaporthiopsis poae (strain ATCC 64411 / 73-15) TaxID=644358 RepID=A0A0C4E186_MAGP6|nr:hypothetical protein MAPG_06140 [Magnaporthiopsis poae ATCC 64411]
MYFSKVSNLLLLVAAGAAPAMALPLDAGRGNEGSADLVERQRGGPIYPPPITGGLVERRGGAKPSCGTNNKNIGCRDVAQNDASGGLVERGAKPSPGTFDPNNPHHRRDATDGPVERRGGAKPSPGTFDPNNPHHRRNTDELAKRAGPGASCGTNSPNNKKCPPARRDTGELVERGAKPSPGTFDPNNPHHRRNTDELAKRAGPGASCGTNSPNNKKCPP